MKDKDRQVIEKFKSLVSQKVIVYEIRVFGSRARGDAAPESDLDVLVVVEDLTRDAEKHISDCAWEAGFEDGIVVVPIVLSKEEWLNGPERHSLLAQAVKSEGVLI